MQDDNSPCKGTIQYPRWHILSANEQFNMRRDNSTCLWELGIKTAGIARARELDRPRRTTILLQIFIVRLQCSWASNSKIGKFKWSVRNGWPNYANYVWIGPSLIWTVLTRMKLCFWSVKPLAVCQETGLCPLNLTAWIFLPCTNCDHLLCQIKCCIVYSHVKS